MFVDQFMINVVEIMIAGVSFEMRKCDQMTLDTGEQWTGVRVVGLFPSATTDL